MIVEHIKSKIQYEVSSTILNLKTKYFIPESTVMAKRLRKFVASNEKANQRFSLVPTSISDKGRGGRHVQQVSN